MSSSLTAGVVARLAGDATLISACPGGVWRYPAPQGLTQPFVTVDFTLGRDEGCGGGPRMTEATYEIVAVAPAAQVATARTAAARIDALLDYQQGWTLTGFLVSGCRRTAPIDQQDEEGTSRWVLIGGEYTLMVEASA